MAHEKKPTNMTEEEKEILLKDLCARLPYNVKVAIDFQPYIACLPDDEDLEYPYRKNLNFILDYDKKTMEDISVEPNFLYAYPCNGRFQMLRGYTYQEDYGVPVEFIKPYLRPMSSMTEEEREDFKSTEYEETITQYPCSAAPTEIKVLSYTAKTFDWLNRKHFDYRGLIHMGLALEAPENMYK